MVVIVGVAHTLKDVVVDLPRGVLFVRQRLEHLWHVSFVELLQELLVERLDEWTPTHCITVVAADVDRLPRHWLDDHRQKHRCQDLMEPVRLLDPGQQIIRGSHQGHAAVEDVVDRLDLDQPSGLSHQLDQHQTHRASHLAFPTWQHNPSTFG